MWEYMLPLSYDSKETASLFLSDNPAFFTV